MKHSISVDMVAPCLIEQQLAFSWIQAVLGIQLPMSSNLQTCLRDGVYLCKLMEKIKPATKPMDIHYENTKESWSQNIQTFLLKAAEAGLSKQQLFRVADLLDGDDMDAVLNTLMVLHRQSNITTMTHTAPQGSSAGSHIDNYHSYGLPFKRRRRRFTVPIRQGSVYLKSSSTLKLDNRSHLVAMGAYVHDEEKEPASIKEQFYYQRHETLTPTWSTASVSVSNDLYVAPTILDDDFTKHHHQYIPPVSKSPAFETLSSDDSGYAKSQRTSSSEFSFSGTTTHPDSVFEPSPLSSPVVTDTSADGLAQSAPSRHSALPFAKKVSSREKLPFRMRYQEWADLKLRKRRSLLITDCKSTHSEGPLSPVSSASSPLASSNVYGIQVREQQQDHQCRERIRQRKQGSLLLEPPPPVMDPVFASRATELGVPRRKSTGTLDAHSYRSSGDKGERLELKNADGTVLARYKLGNQIGKGQFGTVHRALNLKTGQMVAIKRIKLETTKDQAIDDVMQEAELLQTLSHPNIVRYEGFIRSPGFVSIVLEYVENGSLSNTLRAFGSFPESLVACYCMRILEGLVYLHEKNVVHCDLKAANILTTKTGDVKLSDFGVSVNLQLKESVTGSLAGTPNWMAPEVIQLQGASTKSDIWSLGCTIIELFTGKPPYSDLIPMTTLFKIVEDDCPPLPPSASSELLNFLRLCLRKNPVDRPTAKELLIHPWLKQGESSVPLPSNSAPDSVNAVQLKPVSKPISSSFPRSFHYTPLNELDSDIETDREAVSLKRGSILVNKLQERQKSRPPLPQREHCFVKGSFAKSTIRCKACHIPIKRNALICEGGLHSKHHSRIHTPRRC
ncbi:kinase-like domain-containing protein [Dichotomocladium elegans]|nr:kinase-like domain-containing protein [Dichotomocladium elegans]